MIERVPYGDPVSLCHRMVITRKHDGSPRRTVDLSPLNKVCRRETFSAEAPFQLARRVPGRTWKTVMDAWNEKLEFSFRLQAVFFFYRMINMI